MRVLQMVHGFPPWAMAGTEVYTEQLSRALVQRCGIEVVVLAREADPSRPEYALREEARDGLRLIVVNNTFAASRSFEDSYRQQEIRRIGGELLDRVQPDLVHIQHLTGLSTDLPAECAARGIPVVATLHDYWLLCHRGQLLDERLERCDGPAPAACRNCVGAAGSFGGATYRGAAALRRLGLTLPSAGGRLARTLATMRGERAATRASVERLRHMRNACSHIDEFLAPSRTIRDRFLAFGIPASKLELHELGIDTEAFSRVERSPGDRLRIGFLGSLMVSKAPHLLLEAFSRLPEGRASLQVFGAHTSYHGDDSYRRRLEPLLRRTGVQWQGPVSREQIPALLGSLDVLVLPSVWLENSPLVIREAFAAGLPVVASRLGGMAESVVDGQDGLLFEAGSSASLERALRRLLDEPGLLERLRRGIRPVRTIAEDAEATVARYRAHVRSAASARGGEETSLAAVVLNYGTPEATERAVRSLRESGRTFTAILVVDNGSQGGSADALRAALPEATILASERNLGFSGGCNLGIAEALRRGAGQVLLVNSDAELAPGSVERLQDALLADPRHGIAVPVLLSDRQPPRIASAGIAFSTHSGRMRHHGFGRLHRPADVASARPWSVVDAGSGCVMLVSRRLLERIGSFDESFFFCFEDVDFCVRARRAGFATVVVHDALAYHEGSLSIGAKSPRKLYFSTRNHLRAASRTGDSRFPLHRTLRAFWIVALSSAFAMRSGGAPRMAGLRSVAQGTWHHLLGRYDDGP